MYYTFDTVHIDVLMLCTCTCRKIELIPTKTYRVMATYENLPVYEKCPVLYKPMLFSENGPNSPPIITTFSDPYCCPYAI